MIDEKKIEEAAENIYEENFSGNYDYTISEEDHSPLFEAANVIHAVKLGAQWAQQEFIKSLWHDASEEPDFKRPIIFTGKIFFNHIDSWNCPNKRDWHCLKSNYKDFKWCYSKDILPNDYYKE